MPGEIMRQPELGLFRWGTFEVKPRLKEIDLPGDKREIFICGGGQVYAEALPFCSDLIYASQVGGRRRHFFRLSRSQFDLVEEILDCPEFKSFTTAIPRWPERRSSRPIPFCAFPQKGKNTTGDP